MNNETNLIQQVKEDPQKFALIYKKYYNKIYKYFAIRTRDKDLSDDLTSQTFLRAIDKFENYEIRECGFGAWLYRIGHNIMIDHFRQNKETDPWEYNDQIANYEQLTDKIHFKLLAQEIYDLLEQFSKEEKEIILLKLVSDLTFKEIAEILGINENTVKTKYFRNIKILKTQAEKLLSLILLFLQ